MTSTTPVQTRLRLDTLTKVDDLARETGVTRTAAITTSINLYDRIRKLQAEGGELVIRYPDGRERVLVIIS